MNNRALFTSYTPYKKGQSKPIMTGGGPIYPKGVGLATFLVLIKEDPTEFRPLVLKEAFYLPELDTNLVSGLKHYLSGGSLQGNRLQLANKTCCGLLDVAKYGFFFRIKGQVTPRLPQASHYASYASFSYPIEVQLPPKPSWAKDAVEIPLDDPSLGSLVEG